MRSVFLITGMSALVGCTMPVDEEPWTCDAARYEAFLGSPLGDLLAIGPLAPEVRVLRPGEGATLDIRWDRLNIYVDGDDIITAVECG